VKVDLTPEEIQAVNAEIETEKSAIENFDPVESQIPAMEIVQLAKAYEKLGDLEEAIDLYNSWLSKEGIRAKVLANNLGRLYEQVGEWELAVKQYQRIIDEYIDEDYLLDITRTYIRAAQSTKGEVAIEYRKKAEKYFNMWQLALKKTDVQTQQEIKSLRDAEKANK
jgi:tetratricopeptide (TPR) repeat protein